MKHEHHTVVNILHELVGYFVEHDIGDLNINLDIDEDGAWIELEGRIATKPTDLDNLASSLQVERQPEIDDYHDHLLGMHREDEDYNLVGMSVDSAEVIYQNKKVKIKVYRKNLYN